MVGLRFWSLFLLESQVWFLLVD